MTEIHDEPPKGFKFFTGLCIFIGGVGLLVNGIFLLMNFAPGLPPELKEVAPGFWLSALHMARDVGYIIGAKKSREQQKWAPNVVIICATISLFELLYNFTVSVSKTEIPITLISISYMVIALILEGSMIYFFMRRSVKTYVTGSSPSN